MSDAGQFPSLPPAPGSGGAPPPPPPPAPPFPPTPPPYPGSSSGQFPPGQFPPGQFPPGQFPPGQFPPGQFPGASHAPGGYAPPLQPRRNGLAIAALVLGLVSILLFVTGLVPLLALVFGLVGASHAKKSGGAVGGLGQARAGWILGALGLAGCTAFWVAAAAGAFDDGEERVFDAQIGGCYDLPIGTAGEIETISSVQRIDCDEPHNAELFFEGELNPDGEREYPDDPNELLLEVRELCLDPFEEYVGRDYPSSELLIYPVIPDELAWRATRGTFNCYALSMDEPLTSSVEGSGR